MQLRGLLNTLAIQSNRDWVWPFWVESQFNPRLKSFLPRGHSLSQINLTHRNWTILGSLGKFDRAVVDPCGLITPWMGGWSLDCWLATKGNLIVPSRQRQIKQTIHARFPQVNTRFQSDGFRMKMPACVVSVSGESVMLARAQIQNRNSEPATVRFFYSIRPYNPEGISLIRQLDITDNCVWRVNGQLAMILLQVPNRSYCSDLRKGDVSLTLPEALTSSRVVCKTGMATGLAEYVLDLKPQQNSDFTALLTLTPNSRLSPREVLSSFNPAGLRHQLRKSWSRRLSQGSSFHFPKEKLDESFEANKMYLHMFDRG